jgi:COPII coat assembly protein SEC16
MIFNSIATPLNDSPLSVTSLKLSNLFKLEEFVLAGERRQAVQYALDEKLWGHAMLISRSLDSEAWLEVVQAFVNSELDGLRSSMGPESKGSKSIESLKVAYGLFSGFGASSCELVQFLNASLL